MFWATIYEGTAMGFRNSSQGVGVGWGLGFTDSKHCTELQPHRTWTVPELHEDEISPNAASFPHTIPPQCHICKAGRNAGLPDMCIQSVATQVGTRPAQPPTTYIHMHNIFNLSYAAGTQVGVRVCVTAPLLPCTPSSSARILLGSSNGLTGAALRNSAAGAKETCTFFGSCQVTCATGEPAAALTSSMLGPMLFPRALLPASAETCSVGLKGAY